MNALFQRKAIVWSAIIFFACVAILFYMTRGTKIEDKEIVQQISPSPSASEEPKQELPQRNTVNVIEDTGNHTTVRYEKGVFTPHEITVTTEQGCFVEIQNQSNTILTPRLGPYDPQKEQGFPYPPIASGATSLIDPRYGATARFSFYAKENSATYFTVYIDPTCL